MKKVAHWWWTGKGGESASCDDCIHYCDEEQCINLICLQCGHAYGADSEEDMKTMDYPKDDLFLPNTGVDI